MDRNQWSGPPTAAPEHGQATTGPSALQAELAEKLRRATAEERRIVEMERVTRAYGWFARGGAWPGFVPAGLMLVAVAATLWRGASTAAALLQFAAPPTAVAGATIACRLYQRRGCVRPRALGETSSSAAELMRRSERRWEVASWGLLALVVILPVVDAAGQWMRRGGGVEWLNQLAALSALATGVLAWRARSIWGQQGLWFLAMTLLFFSPWLRPPAEMLPLMATYLVLGCALIAAGVAVHLWYVRVRRQLAQLRVGP